MQCVARLLMVICCTLAGLRPGLAQTEKRVALVIGNSAYQHTRALPNPRNDAEAIAKLLRDIGFADVMLETDLDYRAMHSAVRAFAEKAREADVALIYFAGHGLEVGGENYLVPVDAKVVHDRDLQFEAIALKLLLTAVDGARKLKLVILDACRNNPLGEKIALSSGATRSVTRGLARIEPKGDVLVAYSAEAGTLAYDGHGRHSPFTEALLEHMPIPGLDVVRMFGRVRDVVWKTTDEKQKPAIYGSVGGEAVALVPGLVAPPQLVTRPNSKKWEEARADALKGVRDTILLKKNLDEVRASQEEVLARLKERQERAQQLEKKLDEWRAHQKELLARQKESKERQESEAPKAKEASTVKAPESASKAAEARTTKKQGAEKTGNGLKVAALPKPDRPGRASQFDGGWTIAFQGCASGSFTLRIEGGKIVGRAPASLSDSGSVRWTMHTWGSAPVQYTGKLRGNTGFGRFEYVAPCSGTFTARRN